VDEPIEDVARDDGSRPVDRQGRIERRWQLGEPHAQHRTLSASNGRSSEHDEHGKDAAARQAA
jgi:hypothetical protein